MTLLADSRLAFSRGLVFLPPRTCNALAWDRNDLGTGKQKKRPSQPSLHPRK